MILEFLETLKMMMMYKTFLQIAILIFKMIIIGIDPGISGAMCFFEEGSKRYY